MRRVLRALVLPLLLVLAQQGLLVHELRHVAPPDRTEGSLKKEAAGLCKLCLALAQVEATAAPHATPAPLLGGLSFAWLAPAARVLRAAAQPEPHNRGPPAA